MHQITAVTFDLWQTLLLDNRESGAARAMIRLEGTKDHLARFGEEYDLELIREAYQACFRHCQKIREQHRDISFHDQVAFFISNISPGLVYRLDQTTLEGIERIYADSFLIHPPSTHADAASVLHGLKEMGLRLGLISNTGMTPGATFRTYLDQEGLLGYFDVLTFSDEVKLAKPSNEIFLMTLRAMSALPDQAVHVGDHAVNDVVGAKQCGLKTIWITGFSEREDPSDPDSEPDVTVAGLAEVVPAISQLSERRAPR